MICEDIHSALSHRTAEYDSQQVVVLTTAEVMDCHPEIQDYGFPVLALPSGESNKSLDSVQRIWDFLLAHRITRSGLLICIGGGMITDLGGFAASTYKRGIDYINVPTTLLAMIDASTGGKTGLNYNGLKNCIGSFYSPKETIICPAFLQTLPVQQLLSGYAEMLKHGLLANEEEWNRLLCFDWNTPDTAALTSLIESSLAVKQHIISIDPQENGLRKALNLGHTVGHALEEVGLNEGGMLHGYAVLYGLIAELYLSVVRFDFPRKPLQQLADLMIHVYGRPQCKCSDRERLLSLMLQDKKNEHAGEINCTLMSSFGHPEINQIVTTAEMNEALDYLFSL